MGNILTGISSWADRGLVESGFYPDGIKVPADRLRYYSRNFPIVEIDASYHYFPTRRSVGLWLDKYPGRICL